MLNDVADYHKIKHIVVKRQEFFVQVGPLKEVSLRHVFEFSPVHAGVFQAGKPQVVGNAVLEEVNTAHIQNRPFGRCE
jgi:hypothetical protein